jgi:hypothetical protein
MALRNDYVAVCRANVLPYVLSMAQEQALKPGDVFKECAQDCPDMVVLPSGSFVMGAAENERQLAGTRLKYRNIP